MSGVFEALVVSGLFLLIAVVAVATVVLARRSRNNSAGYQARGVPSTTSTLPTGPRSLATASSGTDRSAAELTAGQPGYSAAEVEELRVKAEKLLASAEAARTEAEEESRARRAELREQRADVERREQRLSDREERLDADIRMLEEKGRQLEELKNELKSQRRTLADLEAEQQTSVERIAGLIAEQAKAELVSAVTHDAKRQAVLLARLAARAMWRGESLHLSAAWGKGVR